MRRTRIGGLGVLAILSALAVGCGDITAADEVDSGSPAGAGGHVTARLDSGAGGAVVTDGVGGEQEGTGGRPGVGGAPGAGTGGAAVVGTGGRSAGLGGSSGTAGAGGIPECPLTGSPPHESPCPADSFCNQYYASTPVHHRCSICNTPPYPPGYDLSILPCQGGYLCVQSCENP